MRGVVLKLGGKYILDAKFSNVNKSNFGCGEMRCMNYKTPIKTAVVH